MPSHRKYGRQHQYLRRVWASKVAAGGVDCWRCGNPIPANTPRSKWDLGHVDPEYRRFWGLRHPEHSGCNRATVTHLKQRLERERQRPRGGGLLGA